MAFLSCFALGSFKEVSISDMQIGWIALSHIFSLVDSLVFYLSCFGGYHILPSSGTSLLSLLKLIQVTLLLLFLILICLNNFNIIIFILEFTYLQ